MWVFRVLQKLPRSLNQPQQQEIEKLMQSSRGSLKEFPCIPYPKGHVLEQLDEQNKIYDKIMLAVLKQKGGVFFLHGYGGKGKTFMWRTLASSLRSNHEIVLTVATSGIASLLL
ncbi:PIF1-like helicase [Medicago truncatula]|uniref:ATP-dependent DNA helicase n=1 Tax=Medicago truncatula TaxID=3880 RepID=G7KLY4_MEDTR|nr:PIF1-like helicase [Medicago truncatula]